MTEIASTQRANLFTRDDTFFGVCQGVSEDTGIPADLLRVALVPALFLAPVPTLAGYLAMGAWVFASRKLMPDRRPHASPAAAAPVEAEPMALPLAA